jgi:cell division control protein 6
VLLSNDGGRELINDMVRDERVCVIGVTYNITIKEYIENRNLYSALKPRVIEFVKYDPNELKEILTYWAGLAFYPGALSEEVIRLIAALVARTNGDARYAIDLLARSAEVALRKSARVFWENT